VDRLKTEQKQPSECIYKKRVERVDKDRKGVSLQKQRKSRECLVMKSENVP
jgi:hypothetical protein